MADSSAEDFEAANALMAMEVFQRAARLGCPKCRRAPNCYKFPPGEPDKIVLSCPAGHLWRPDVEIPEA